jgi:hypothetical protein
VTGLSIWAKSKDCFDMRFSLLGSEAQWNRNSS